MWSLLALQHRCVHPSQLPIRSSSFLSVDEKFSSLVFRELPSTRSSTPVKPSPTIPSTVERLETSARPELDRRRLAAPGNVSLPDVLLLSSSSTEPALSLLRKSPESASEARLPSVIPFALGKFSLGSTVSFCLFLAFLQRGDRLPHRWIRFFPSCSIGGILRLQVR